MDSDIVVQLLFHPISLTGFIIFLVSLLLRWLLFPQTSSSEASPPSPPKLPIFGHLLNLGSHPHLTFQNYARRYGPLFLLHLGSKPTLVVSSPEMARDIMKTHDLVFANRPKSSMADKLLYNSKDISAAPYGEYWRQMKSLAVIHLLSNKRVQSFRNVREEEIKLMVHKIRQDPLSVNLSQLFSEVTNDVVCRVALGRKYAVGEDGNNFHSVLLQFEKLLGSFSIRDFIPWLGWIDAITGLDAEAEWVAKELDALFERVIEDHVHQDKTQSSEEEKDLVDVLLRIAREDSIGFPLDKQSVKALILDMFVAGTDTTYAVVEWAMSELLRNPKAMKKLQSEVEEIVGKKEYVSEDDLERMFYLKAIIKETFRLHPPVPLLLPRESSQDIRLKGYKIKAGTQVIINAWAIGRNTNVWEEAEEFRPERFLNNPLDFKGQDFELIPFGAGRRGCPGILFGVVLDEIILANVVHKFKWTLFSGANGKGLDMTQIFGLTIHRKFPLVANATPC